MQEFHIIINDDIIEILKETYENKKFVQLHGENNAVEHMRCVLSSLIIPPMFTTLRINDRIQEGQSYIDELTTTLNDQYAKRGWEKPEISQLKEITDIVVIKNRKAKVCEPILNKEVVVDLQCGMAVLRGADVYAQGIHSIPHGTRLDDPVSVYADLNGKCHRGATEFSGPKQFVGNGVLNVLRSRLFSREKINGIGVEMLNPLYEAPSLSDLPSHVFPQNLPSIVCGHVLNPKPGEIILDMCASPGGKTTHLAALVNNEARIVAIDKSAAKVARIEKNIARMGITCVQTYVYDSTKLRQDDADVGGAPPYRSETFDRILADAPCSAMGQRPSWACSLTPNILRSFPTYQRKLLSQAVALLKVGGTLVYSTCTLPLAENEAQVSWMLAQHECMQLVPQTPHVGGRGMACECLSQEQCHLLQRFDPADMAGRRDVTTDTIGFFIAKFRKKNPR